MEGGIITRDEILAHPTEHGQAVTVVDHHVALFDHPPGLVAADRGVHAADTEARLRERGTLGQMASLRRDHGWRACRSHGLDGMERWLGLGVMAGNLRRIARTPG